MDLLRRWSPTFSGNASKARPMRRDGQRVVRFAGVRAVAAFGLLSIAGCGTPLDPGCWERADFGIGNVDPMIPWNYLCSNDVPLPDPPERPEWLEYQKPGNKYDKTRNPKPESDND